MPYTVVFLWISAGAQPNAAELSDLRDFGAARGLTFVPGASAAARSGLPPRDDVLVDRLESELEQARTALSALEEGSASERLTRVQAELLAHPHLPQAAYLMAECLALQAQAARATDPALARRLELQRSALEGPRAAAFGEAESPSPGGAAAPPQLVRLSGVSAADTLEIDGSAELGGSQAQLSLALGLHHFRVWRGGEPVLATFAEVSAGQSELSLHVPVPLPCSAADLASARDGGAPQGVSCAGWARVRAEPHGVGVALCQRSLCGDFVHWQRRSSAPFAPIEREREGLPAWAGFGIAGAAVLLATGLVLWQSGALDRSRPSATTLEYAGYQPRALRF